MKTNSKGRSPIWPYLAILGCLFVLSISAPRAWDRMHREATLAHALATRKSNAARQSSHMPTSRDAASETVETGRTGSTSIEGSDSSQAAGARVSQLADMVREIRAEIAILDQPGLADAAPVAVTIVEPATEAASEAAADPVAELIARADQVSRASDPTTVSEVAEERSPGVSAGVSTDSAAASQSPASESVAAGEPSAVAEESSQEEQDETAAPATESGWPMPRTLVNQLTQLAAAGRSAKWTNAVLEQVKELCQSSAENPKSRQSILKKLRELSDHGLRGEVHFDTQLARAQYTLNRWLDIWDSTSELELLPAATSTPEKTAQRVRRCLDVVDPLASRNRGGEGWREYLKLDALRRLTAEGTSEEVRRAMARKVLDRMVSTRLTKSQMRFANEGPLAALKVQLRVWATEPVSAAQLLKHLEQYEHTGLVSDARLVAGDIRALGWAAPAEAERISERLDRHYRNANLRIAATASLLNRLVPQPQRIDAEVNDTVLNVPVYGNSSTQTRLTVQLIPDQERIRVALVAKGLVDSETVATSGPATFRSQGQSSFVVRKLMVVGPYGLSVWPAVAEADNSFNYLRSLETDYDGMPLIRSLVRNMALSRHEESQWQARNEVEQKIAARARAQLDGEVQPQMIKMAENIEKKELALLDRLGLEVMPIGYSTTEDRVSARVRVSTPEQLGGHTPRPRAPSDSWYSLQLHESAINNAMEQLSLNGRSFELPQLMSWVGAKLDRPQMTKLDDLPEDVRMKFAGQDSVRVRCEAGRIEVIMSFAELTQGRSRWHDFTVHAFYKPEPRKSEAVFVRDGSLSLEGRSVKGKSRFVLLAIFSKVLSVNRPITMLGDKITSDRRIRDLGIAQFTVDDGWIALAYGPNRPRANVVRRPQ